MFGKATAKIAEMQTLKGRRREAPVLGFQVLWNQIPQQPEGETIFRVGGGNEGPGEEVGVIAHCPRSLRTLP